MTDTAPLPRVHPDHQPVCIDASIGHLVPAMDGGPRSRVPIHLSVDVEFWERATSRWLGGVIEAEDHNYRLRGTFLELATQVSIRYGSRSRTPSRWVPGFGVFGAPDGPWPLARFRPASGLDLADLVRLAELSREYDRNMTVLVDGPIRAVFIPREVEQEIRDIAGRLRR